MSVSLTRTGPGRETSTSSGGFSHSQTGITAEVPVTAGTAARPGRCCSSERHRAVARSTNPERAAPSAPVSVPDAAKAPIPMSSSPTGRPSRPASTSQIRSGTWPRGRWPLSQRETAVCSYRRPSPRVRPARLTWPARPARETPASSIRASSRTLGSIVPPGACRDQPSGARFTRGVNGMPEPSRRALCRAGPRGRLNELPRKRRPGRRLPLVTADDPHPRRPHCRPARHSEAARTAPGPHGPLTDDEGGWLRAAAGTAFLPVPASAPRVWSSAARRGRERGVSGGRIRPFSMPRGCYAPRSTAPVRSAARATALSRAADASSTVSVRSAARKRSA